jgi:hypothetical protein
MHAAGSRTGPLRCLKFLFLLVLLAVASIASSCSKGADSVNPRERLEVLGRRWFASSATITYRTTEREPGDPTSPHQCLRQLVGVGEADVKTGLRLCSGVGEMRLAWDPPERWRMDEVFPGGSVTRVSTSEGLLRCAGGGMDMSACVDAERDGPFGSLVDPPDLSIDEIGAAVTAEAERTIAGIRSDCFAVEGGPAGTVHRMEWCYSPEGLLLFLTDTVEGGRVVTAEATEVSRGVVEGDFAVPSR